jgi:thiosulfate dehydrogenase
MNKKYGLGTVLSIALAATGYANFACADEFTPQDTLQWTSEFQAVVKKGREAFTDGKLGSNGVVCAQCHPNGSNTHPETYPKFQKQLGRVAALWEMINWCIKNPLEGKELAADDPKMIAMQTYIAYERRGAKMDPGKH